MASFQWLSDKMSFICSWGFPTNVGLSFFFFPQVVFFSGKRTTTFFWGLTPHSVHPLIVLFNNQPLPQGVGGFLERKIPWKEWNWKLPL